MQRAIIIFAALAAAMCLCHQTQAQQGCKCPTGFVSQCVSTSGGWTWVAPRGSGSHKSMPVPIETMLAGMTYVLKPTAEKQAYLQSLPSQDRQLILANLGTLTSSVQSLKANHLMYQQEMQAKVTTAP